VAKLFVCCASISGFLAVVIGAFGAHGLKGKLSDAMMSAYATGVQYHFYHTLALLAVALYMLAGHNSRLLLASCVFFLLGLVGFSGSLYWLALGGPKWLGPVTPIGGLCFMVAWLVLFSHFLLQPGQPSAAP